jgi:DNA-binding LacI/PurR family transcriptional regulator
MKQVSEAAGVSQSTVSRVLNGTNGRVPIGEETRQRVLRLVEELGYRPHPLARGLRGAGTALLGLIVREIADPFFASTIEAIASEVRRHGYSLVLGHARSSVDEALALAGVLETRHCDGVLLLGDLQDEPRLWAELTGSNLAIVGLCLGPRSRGVPNVNTDNRQGVRLAFQHLYGLGHRRIAFVDAGWLDDVAERREAYFDLAKQHRLAIPEGYHQPGDNRPQSGWDGARALLALPEPPTAVLCATDQVAQGALAACAAGGVRIPAEISVVGFDDIPMASFTVPPLTTVRQPIELLAREAVDRLLAAMGGDRRGPALVRLEPELVVRATTAAPGR